MGTSISAIGVILAAFSAFVVGGLWYSPTGFLNQWMKLTGATQEDMKNNFSKSMIFMGVGALLTAYILAHFMLYTHAYTGASGVMNGLQTAFWAWLGLSLTTTVAHGIMEPRDGMLMVINAANRLVTFLLMGLILGLFM